jgi:hypothetical protein
MFWGNIGLSTLIYEENGGEGEFEFGYFGGFLRGSTWGWEEGGHLLFS